MEKETFTLLNRRREFRSADFGELQIYILEGLHILSLHESMDRCVAEVYAAWE